jgi:hypothetical protein
MAKELTDKHKKFLDVLFDEAGGNATAAKRLAGFSDGYSTREITNFLKEEIVEATQLYIAMNAPKAARAIVDGIMSPTELGIKEKLSAAKDLLDRAGFVKTDKVQVETNNGIMILPAKDRAEED